MSEEKEDNIARVDEEAEIKEADKSAYLREKMGIEDDEEISLEGTILVLLKRIEWLEAVCQGLAQEVYKEEEESRIIQ